ncbi:nitrate reductase [Nocardioides sp. Soil797]|nr:nitrate reductase [Nocardioides sp. Soil797]
MSARHPRPTWSPEQLTVAWQSASVLLGYPDADQAQALPLVAEAVTGLPAAARDPLGEVVSHLRSADRGALQESYVETFDNRRRCNLFLTYFAHGDTRKRGVALLRFKQTYLRSGFLLDESELPDHLCVVLEYAATVDRALGWGLLLDHRAGLELLRLALLEEESPWAGALEAVCSTLPPLRGDEWDAVRRLAVEGPPAEEVGLTPYGDPALTGTPVPSGPTDLPMPAMRSPEGSRA